MLIRFTIYVSMCTHRADGRRKVTKDKNSIYTGTRISRKRKQPIPCTLFLPSRRSSLPRGFALNQFPARKPAAKPRIQCGERKERTTRGISPSLPPYYPRGNARLGIVVTFNEAQTKNRIRTASLARFPYGRPIVHKFPCAVGWNFSSSEGEICRRPYRPVWVEGFVLTFSLCEDF